MSLAAEATRDPRIEDPTNRWIVHPAGRFLLPFFVALGISANAVSVGGFLIGSLAALAFARWTDWPFVWAGLLLATAWLIADGLDGMIARATGTAGPVGRLLDGLCDHGTFMLIYALLAASLGTPGAWVLAGSAAVVHAIQSNFYEGERARFHRRRDGSFFAVTPEASNVLLRTYDRLAAIIDRSSNALADALVHAPDPAGFAKAYSEKAKQPLRLMSLLSANVRVWTIFLACLLKAPSLFWWVELVPLSVIMVAGILWRQLVDARFINDFGGYDGIDAPCTQTLQHKDFPNL
jgi:CDP-diacylglycerol---serine O-phosphatidyltransferase